MKQAKFSSSFMQGFVAILLFVLVSITYIVIGRTTTGYMMLGWNALLGIVGGCLPAILLVSFENYEKAMFGSHSKFLLL